ncbi:uncharacterized protein EV154DRAFT_503061 [Mucor mucedo]|uniref:uncharacterized protein n=1 Tax=Mucor mucedo TaxID=29922 RepID=UPI00221F0E83|nr:uncharacterized protein EV154DRAFT_503061 [Mucor mucedo]KAI7893042.1 hypothetical protein EV154DRAFT_503061 [Mucor mucedo]
MSSLLVPLVISHSSLVLVSMVLRLEAHLFHLLHYLLLLFLTEILYPASLVLVNTHLLLVMLSQLPPTVLCHLLLQLPVLPCLQPLFLAFPVLVYPLRLLSRVFLALLYPLFHLHLVFRVLCYLVYLVRPSQVSLCPQYRHYLTLILATESLSAASKDLVLIL